MLTTELTTEHGSADRVIRHSSSMRVCPNCAARDSLHYSRRRNFLETLSGIVMPFVRPYRCHGCNWRGFLGRFDFVSSARLNRALNVTVFGLLILFCLYQVIRLYGMHPFA